ncbi:hypothetical protein ACFE04_000629 [Oxalis oulophora]
MGAIIVDQYVTIRYWGTLYAGEPDDPNNSSSKVVDNRCSKAICMAQYASPPDEAATKAQQPVKTIVSKGYILGKDAFLKAKAFDDSYHVSSIAAASLVIGIQFRRAWTQLNQFRKILIMFVNELLLYDSTTLCIWNE